MKIETSPRGILDRRNFNLAAFSFAVSACGADSSAQRPESNLTLRRGIAVRVLAWPELDSEMPLRFVWPPFQDSENDMPEAEFAAIRQMGFDFVRVPVSPEVFMASRGARAGELLNIMRAKIDPILAAGLRVVVDLHPNYNVDRYNPDRLVASPQTFARYLGVVADIAGKLDGLDGVALELMNEPPVRSISIWQVLARRMAEAARREAPNLPLVVSGHNGDGYEELCALTPLPSSLGPAFYTFHYYEPGIFTHQTQIDIVRHLSGVEWPPQRERYSTHMATAERLVLADEALPRHARAAAIENARQTLDAYYERNHSAEMIESAFAQVAAWADQHSVPRERVLLGEFGVVRTHWLYEGADEASRTRWLQAVRTAAETQGFGWSAWVFSGWGGMAVTDRNTRAFDADTARALGLTA